MLKDKQQQSGRYRIQSQGSSAPQTTVLLPLLSEQVVTREWGSEPALGKCPWAGQGPGLNLRVSAACLGIWFLKLTESTDLKDLGHLVFGIKGCRPRELHVRV